MQEVPFRMKLQNYFVLSVCVIIILSQIPVQRADAKKYKYDSLDRVEKVQYEDGGTVTYTYDANGNIKSVTTNEGKKDPSGRDEESGQNNTGGTGGKNGEENPDMGGENGQDSPKDTDGKNGQNTANTGGGNQGAGTDGNTGNTGMGELDGQPAGEATTGMGGQADAQTGEAGAGSASSKDYTGKMVSTKTAGYQITRDGKTKEAAFLKAGKGKTTMKIPDTITYKGNRYKVTQIGSGACKGNTKLKKITVGKYVTTIGAKAFYGCKSLKKVTITSKKLKKVGSKAFTNTHKKLVVKVPKSKLKSYQKLLKGKGMKKTAKVKK